MRKSVFSFFGMILCLTFSFLFSLEVPFDVNNWAPLVRSGEPVTGGIPLPQGVVTDLNKLRIVDGAGNTVPAQFKWLSKWWWEKNQGQRIDPSIKWVLCDFKADVAAKDLTRYTLKDDNTAGAPTNLLSVSNGIDKITVVTGPMKFVVSKSHFNLFDELWLDINGNGSFDVDEAMMVAGNGSGGFIKAGDWSAGGCVAGTVHKSTLQAPDTVIIQEQGPMKVVIRIEGRHFASANGVSQGLYGYQVFITAYAGQPYADVKWAVTNHYLEGAGTRNFTRYVWPFSSYELRLVSNMSGAKSYGFYTDTLLNESVGSMPGSGSVRLLQKLGSFSLSSGGSGTKSKGMAALYNGSRGLMFGMRDFSYNTPKGIRLSGDTLIFEAFPDTTGGLDTTKYFLDDAQRKSHNLRIGLFGGSYTSGMLRDFYRKMDAPLRVLCPQEWYASTGAWYHRGFSKVPAADWQRMDKAKWDCYFSKKLVLPVQSWANGNGGDWRSFGKWIDRFSSPGDHWNLNSVFYAYLCTGDPSVFEMAERRTWWFNDMMRIGHGAKRKAELSARSVEYCVTPHMYIVPVNSVNSFPGYKVNTIDDLSPTTSGHCLQHQLIEYYMLTGDPLTYETMMDMSEYTTERAIFRPVYDGNDWGWPWRGWQHHNPVVKLDTLCFGSDRYIARPGLVSLHAYEVTGDTLPHLYAARLSAYSIRNWFRWTPAVASQYDSWDASKSYKHPYNFWKSLNPDDSVAPSGAGAQDMMQGIANELLYAYWQVTHDDEIYDGLINSTKGMDWRMNKDPVNTDNWGFMYSTWSDFCMEGRRYNDCGIIGTVLGEHYGGYNFGYMLGGKPEFWDVAKKLAYKSPTHLGYSYIYGAYDPTDWRTLTAFACAYKHDSLDAIPPSAVVDLSVIWLGGGQYRFTWTAPGGDGTLGRAKRYRMKYSRVPIVDATTRWNRLTEGGWPDLRRPLHTSVGGYIGKAQQFQKEQEILFWAIPNNIIGEPVPGEAGSAENFTATGLPDTSDIYFALVSEDSAYNVSALSNVVSVIPTVASIRIKGRTDLEVGASSQLSSVLTYSGGMVDSSGKGVYYRSLDPDVAFSTWYGKVVGTEKTGSARIEIRRGQVAVDTVIVNVGTSTSYIRSIKVGMYYETYFDNASVKFALANWVPMDSMRMLSGDVYYLRVYKAVWSSGLDSFERALPDSMYDWRSSNPSVATVDKHGKITGVGSGRTDIIVGLGSGVKDTVTFTIWPRPAFIRRFNFESDSIPDAFGWQSVFPRRTNPDRQSCSYNATRGFGLDDKGVKDAGAFSFNDAGSIVMKTFMGTGHAAFSNPWDYTATGGLDLDFGFKVDIPKGEYIVRTSLGCYGKKDRMLRTEWITVGTDTIAWNPIVPGKGDLRVGTVTNDTISVVSDTGILVNVHGACSYIVLISKEGIDMNLVAYDTGNLSKVPLSASSATVVTVEQDSRTPIVTDYTLSAFPNPFNPSVTFVYSLPQSVTATYKIFDIRGRVVASYAIDGSKYGRIGKIKWDGVDMHGNNAASGLYIGKLVSNKGMVISKSMMLVR